MLIGCIADDFTGASGIANTLTVNGMRTVLVPGEPHRDPPTDADGVVVAGAKKLSARLDGLFATLAKGVIGRGMRRLVVAGGETSSTAVSGLDLDGLWVSREIDTGVPVLINEGDTRFALALKSGNFGDDDFLARALAAMERS